MYLDDSDAQYHGFRSNFMYLAAFALLFHFAKKRYQKLIFSICFVCFIHGFHVIVLFTLVMLNYILAKVKLEKFVFLYAILTLLWARKQQNTGLYPWFFSYNFVVLRMISFTMDYKRSHSSCTLHQCKKGYLCPKLREELPQIGHYNAFNYFSYIFYPPLYLSGPIMTYNSFIADFYDPPIIEKRDVLIYTLRLLGCFFLLEIIIRIYHPIATIKAAQFKEYTPTQIVCFAMLNLMHIWLKLLVIWRSHRLWALTNGINPVENMQRCVINNNSCVGFWRYWHVSFNKWNKRYIYIPLGGRKNILSTWAVFSFVAVWHDADPRLWTWGLFIAAVCTLEITTQKLFRKYKDEKWYPKVATLGYIGLIYLQVIGNSIGFAASDARLVASKVLNPLFLLQLVPFLYVGVKLQSSQNN